MTTEIKKLAAAIDTIASFFHEEYEHTDVQTGLVETRNSYQFIQTKVLNGICYQLANALDFTANQTLKNAQRRLNTLLRDADHAGDDKVQAEIDRALNWIERLKMQMATTEAALNVAKDGYKRATGEEFSFTARGTAPVAPVAQTEMQKRIAQALKAA